MAGYTEIDSKLDFSGKTLYTITRHKKDNGGGSTEIVTRVEYNYSGQDRLLTNTHQITSTSNPKQLLLSNTYDELGQLITKKVGGLDVSGTVGLQKVDYKYNIRGWLKEINNVDNLIESATVPKDLFAFKINYNDNPITGLNAQETAIPQLYNGNISETVWRTASDDKKRKYGYVYDDLNRLNNAIFQDPTASVVTNSFNENLTYDKNGNILSLNRNDYIPSLPYNTAIDNLTYSYHAANKNQLVKVTDSSLNTNGFKDGTNGSDDFTYDANGNMLTDLNKGITTSIVYNHLNLPTRIVFSTGNIEYLYNALGQKTQKKVTQTSSTPITTTTTLYLNGGYQYINNNLEYFPTAEGYVKYTNNIFSSYVFNYTDHLGNVRVSYKENTGSLQILEENNYYPFGLKHKNYNANNYQPTYKYKYQGQERQDELGLNWDSFKWRNYDYAIGRFMSLDKLAEDYSYQSPYNFAENRVMDGRELEGLEWRSSTSSDGKTVSLTLSVKTINNTSGIISNKEMANLANQRASQLSSSLGGTDSQGRTVNVSVEYNNKATISWEYTDGNDTSNRTYTGKDASIQELGDQMASGLTDKIGDTQNNRTQVNLYQTDTKGNQLPIDNKEVSKNGAHEDGHTVGLRHEKKDTANKLAPAQQKDSKNLMNQEPNGTNILPEQRTQAIKLIEQQQPKK